MQLFLISLSDDEDKAYENFIIKSNDSEEALKSLLQDIVMNVKEELSESYTVNDLSDAIKIA